MAGSIFLNKNQVWSVGSSPFNWVLEFLVQNCDDQNIIRRLREIDESNLQSIDLEDFLPEERRKILELLKTKLVSGATTELPQDLSNRDEYLKCFKDLEATALKINV